MKNNNDGRVTTYKYFLNRRKELNKEIDENNNQLKVLLRNDVHDVLLSKGFIDFKPYQDTDYVVIHPDFDFVIDFSYVYSDHVHLRLGHISNNGAPWYGEDTTKWYFCRKIGIEEVVNKILETYTL